MNVGNSVGNTWFPIAGFVAPATLLCNNINVVRMEGLEPPRLAAPEPKSNGNLANSMRWLFDFPNQTVNASRKWEMLKHQQSALNAVERN